MGDYRLSVSEAKGLAFLRKFGASASRERFAEAADSLRTAVRHLNEAAEEYQRQGLIEKNSRARGLISLAQGIGLLGAIFDKTKQDQLEEALVTCQTSIDFLKRAAQLFHENGFVAGEDIANSLQIFAKARFYEIHGKRQFQTFGFEKASRYYDEAFNAYFQSFQVLSRGGLLAVAETARLQNDIAELQSDLSERGARLTKVETQLQALSRELEGLSTELSSHREHTLEFSVLKERGRQIGTKLNVAVTVALFAIITTFAYATIGQAFGLHMLSVFDTILVGALGLAVAAGLVLFRQTHRLQNLLTKR